MTLVNRIKADAGKESELEGINDRTYHYLPQL
jgi:hypothetical protein